MKTIEVYKQLLAEFIKFQSISTDMQYQDGINQALAWLERTFEQRGFHTKVLKGKSSNPVIMAKFIVNPDYQTALIYGHYDVQPAEMEQGWNTDPFTLNESDGRFYGRGTVDNKGQVLIHMVSIFDLIERGELNYNVIFLIEGNEETGNDDLGMLLKEYQEELKCDIAMISDGEIVQNYPLIEASLRGGMNVKLTIKSANFDVHSGLYGGAITNAAVVMSELIAQMYSGNMILIPGFYDNVDVQTEEEMKNTQRMEAFTSETLNLIGAKGLMVEEGQNFFSQTGLRPTMQVTGIKSGYFGEGYANIVPFFSEARFNFRTVHSQNVKNLYQNFKDFVQNNLPKSVEYTIEYNGMHEAIKLNVSSTAHQKAKSILTEVFNKEPLVKYVGGAIPFVVDIKETLGIDALLIPLGNEDCNMHGPNENITEDLVNKGLEFSQRFFAKAD